MDDQPHKNIRLDYGHADPNFAKPSAAQGMSLVGFALAVVPAFMIGANLYDINTVIEASHMLLPRRHEYWAFAFFAVVFLAGVMGIHRFRKSPPTVRYFLLGFMAGLAVMGLMEGMCFGMR